MKFNNKGMSLLNVIIAASILGAIMFATSSFIISTLKTQKNIEQVADLSIVMEEVKVLLGNTTRCTSYLHDQLISNDLTIKDMSQGIDISPNAIKSGWKIQSIKIDKETLLPDGNKLAKLVFKVTKEVNKSGLQNLVRELTMEYKPKIISGQEAIDTCSLISNINVEETVKSLTFPDSTCSPGEYAVGFSKGKVICSNVPANVVQPAKTPITPGAGCDTAFCVANDFGPCEGFMCKTNGNYCKGFGCHATGTSATCDGMSCKTGPI